jgi:hypothetical protein
LTSSGDLYENQSVEQTGFLKEAEMTSRDIERIRFVTRHFNELQGLRTLVPMGVLLTIQGAAHFFRDWPFTYFIVILAILGSLAWYPRADRYYRRTFGEVEQRQAGLGMGGSSLPVYSPAGRAPLAAGTRPLDPRLRWLILAAVAAYALLLLLKAILPSAALLTDRSRVDSRWLHPLLAQMMCYIFGTLLLGMWFLKRERRLSQTYYLAIGLSLLGLAVLGSVLGLILPELRNLKVGSILQLFLPFLADPSWAQILCGTSMVLAGLLDHLQLVRVLRPVGEEEA